MTETHNTFARRHALAEIASASADGMSVVELEAMTSRYLGEPEVVSLAVEDGGRYTTVGTV